jgi:hypothetical protein
MYKASVSPGSVQQIMPSFGSLRFDLRQVALYSLRADPHKELLLYC